MLNWFASLFRPAADTTKGGQRAAGTAAPVSGRQGVAPSTPADKLADKEVTRDHWGAAIAAADSGQRAVALQQFRRAIDTNPDYYVSVVQPSSAQARAIWNEAVEQYKREADVKASGARSSATRCAQCGTDIGVKWHYRSFESIELAATVAAQCPSCGRLTCNDDLKFGPDGNYPPCSECGAHLEVLSEGPAYSSMVEQASRERRYRGAIKQPSALGRPVQRG